MEKKLIDLLLQYEIGIEKRKPMLTNSEYRITNREFLPIENYQIQCYANGTILALWQKNFALWLYLKAHIKKDDANE
jgi:hypothetical protein